jgi:Ca-activated chloride channel family protein
MNTLTEVVGFEPVNAQTGKEIKLSMQRLLLVGKVLPVGARLVVQHTFSSQENEPLEVIYSFPLPRDAALRRFRVTGKGFSVHSQLKPVEEAVKAYEEGIEKGHLSTLVRQYRDGMVNLNLGNLRPKETITVYLELLAGVELHDRGFRFRFPFTLAPGYHSRARSVAVDAGTGEIELSEDQFGDLILPQFKEDSSQLHQVGFDLSIYLPTAIAEVGSPSHGIRFSMGGLQRGRVTLAEDHDLPNRDLVLDVKAKENLLGVVTGMGKDGKGHFVAILPSESFGKRPDGPRRIVFVVDRSGSMGGAPIDQAKKAIEACLGALSGTDQFSLVAFDNHIESFRQNLVSGTMESREALRNFLQGIDARGGTELAAGFMAAARMLGREGGDVMLVTDGQVMGTEDILKKARSAGIRIHILGIGSASQDRFLSLLAQQTGGVSRFLTPRERIDLPAVELFASIGKPIAASIQVKTEKLPGVVILPEPQSAVFAGTPLVVYGETEGQAEGALRFEWTADQEKHCLVEPLQIKQDSIGETLRLIRGAKLITDTESRVPGSEVPGAAGKRQEDRLLKRLEALSQTYGLASRQMALVAVVEREGDKPGQLPETRIVPVGIPQDVSFGSYFADQGAMPMRMLGSVKAMRGVRLAALGSASLDAELMSLVGSAQRIAYPKKSNGATKGFGGAEDLLLELAARIESDGGMPGTNDEQRVLSTLGALFFFVAEGHTSQAGAFRTHVQRMIAFLQSDITKHLTADKEMIVRRVCKEVSIDRMIPGDWALFIGEVSSGQSLDSAMWNKIELALTN